MTDDTQPAALRLAEMLTAEEWPGNVTIVSYARECVAELRTQHAHITELESQLAQRFDAADMATAAAQGFRDGVASVSAGSEPVAEIGSAAGDCAAFGERALYPLVDIDRFDYGTMLYTHPSPPEGMAGWKWVPIEPTDAMWNAMMDWGTKKSEWLAILDAAPAPVDGESNG